MNENILIVEDNEFVLKNLVRLLKLERYNVTGAENGEIALRMIHGFKPDLIISDIMMPVLDGYKLYQQLQRDTYFRNTPFIFLTSKSEQNDIRFAKKLGADDYIVKPYDSEEVLIAVRSRLDKFNSIRESIRSEVEELKQEILFKLSHEIRTPIAVVKGVSELIASSKHLALQDLHQMAQILNHGSSRLERLINKFLTVEHLSEILQNKQKRELYKSQFFEIPTDMKETLRDSFESQLASQNLSMRIEWNSNGNHLYPVYPNHLKSIISELMENAIKFSVEGNEVVLRVDNSSEGLSVEMTDYGIGVPANEIPKLFTKFYQYNRQKMEQQGAGLGLTIVQSIINLYNGDIEFRSEVGKGTTVRIYFRNTTPS